VKPFLLLAIRAEDAAADNEYESFLAYTGLDEKDLRRVRLEGGRWGTSICRNGRGSSLAAACSTPATRRTRNRRSSGASRPTCVACSTR
jgi:hypothetical protein